MTEREFSIPLDKENLRQALDALRSDSDGLTIREIARLAKIDVTRIFNWLACGDHNRITPSEVDGLAQLMEAKIDGALQYVPDNRSGAAHRIDLGDKSQLRQVVAKLLENFSYLSIAEIERQLGFSRNRLHDLLNDTAYKFMREEEWELLLMFDEMVRSGIVKIAPMMRGRRPRLSAAYYKLRVQ